MVLTQCLQALPSLGKELPGLRGGVPRAANSVLTLPSWCKPGCHVAALGCVSFASCNKSPREVFLVYFNFLCLLSTFHHVENFSLNLAFCLLLGKKKIRELLVSGFHALEGKHPPDGLGSRGFSPAPETRVRLAPPLPGTSTATLQGFQLLRVRSSDWLVRPQAPGAGSQRLCSQRAPSWALDIRAQAHRLL